MTMASIIWWPKQIGTNTRFNKEAFESVGCEVEVTSSPSSFTELIFTPIPGVKNDTDIPMVTQLSGYGPNLVLPNSKLSPKVGETFKYSDVVTVIDPNMLHELRRNGVDEEVKLVPNPAPPITIADDSETNRDFTVLCPQGDARVKKPDQLIEVIKKVGEKEPDIKFVLPSKSDRWRNPIEWLELNNLRIIPHQSFGEMMSLYSQVDLVLHFSSAEILPWTHFETFLAAKPLITKDMGRIQTINRELMPEMCGDLGMDCREFDEKWRGEYDSGDHYVHVDTMDEAVEAVLNLHSNEKRRLELGNNALDWVNHYLALADKGKAILEVAGIG